MLSIIPADVPIYMHAEFLKNYTLLTRSTGNLFLFSADHKIEHLDRDFHGTHVDKEAHDPHHLFKIASKAPIGGMATQLGLIARYGNQYPNITYVAKLNSKSNLIPSTQQDPISKLLWDVEDVLSFSQSSGLTIAGIGVTVYLGSEHEDIMLRQAAQSILKAHQHGLVAILWMYPRGKAVPDETDPELLAGAVGVANALGADFVKIHPPKVKEGTSYDETLRFIVEAAGNTKVLTAGGTYKDEKKLLKDITAVLNNGFSGAAIGRSLFQHSLKDALSLTQELTQLIYTS